MSARFIFRYFRVTISNRANREDREASEGTRRRNLRVPSLGVLGMNNN